MGKKHKILRRISPAEKIKKAWRKIKWTGIISLSLGGAFFLIVLVSSAGMFLTGLVSILTQSESTAHKPSFGMAGKAKNLSPKVINLSAEIEAEADKQGIKAYAEVLKAIMMVETGGEQTVEDFPDVFGCSESPFNTRYPNTIGAIKDYKYSIEVGVKTLAYMVDKLNCENPNDINMLKNVLQSYNCGEQFYFWMVSQYGNDTFSVEVAYAYTASHNDAGQPEYIPRIMNYYTFSTASGGTGGDAVPGNGKFFWPLDSPYDKSYITSDSSGRYNPVTGEWQNSHGAIDIGADKGTPIYSAAAGTVIMSGWHDSYGNYVKVDHGDGWATLYAHQSRTNCNVGDQVAAGQVIGYVGSTGNSTGDHLHFEIRHHEARLNPLDFYE